MTRTRLLRAAVCLLAALAVSASVAASASAAPAYRAHAQANGTISWGGGSATVARPTGTANTDLLIATIRASATWNVTDVQWATSHGWTLLQDNGDAGKTYYRQAGASANYTLLSWGSATFPLENWVGTITAFSGVDLTAPVVGSGTAATGSGTSAALPNDTADRDGSMRFTATMINGTNATTFSAGLTKAADIGASSMGISGAWELQDTGVTPARTASWSSSRSWIAHTVIMRGTEDPPTVTDVSPDQGPTAGGTSVTITGTNFSAATAVSFGGTNAPGFTVNSSTQITVAAPARAAGTAAVRVTNSGGQSADTAADDYTYVAAPTVTGIAPASGPAPGGTSVTITGTNLTAASAVTFGGVNATGYTVDSPTQITATAPAGSGTVDVRVTTVGGQSANTAADNFTYIPAPAITSIAPSTGPESGGTVVVITGTNFTGASQVQFGATNAAGYAVNSATQITATAPAATGVQNIRVTTPSGTSADTAADDFTFVAAPTVTSLAPTQGPTVGGTSVTITGTTFTGVSAVTFGGVNATGYTVDSATQITATAPAGAAGTADVRVTATGGQSANTAADDYTFVAAPTITGISPDTGAPAGGTTVTITGTNLTAASAVTFGGVNATGYTVDSATQITATSPAGTGIVDIRVTTAGGQSANTAADDYAYTPPPSVTSLAPSSGPTGGGTTVTITGTNLTDASAVTFGGVNATGYTVDSATQITATAPAASAGTVDVRVTTPGGQSANTAADNYTYVAAPTVTNLSPTSGPAAGGTSVTITGTNLTGASAVTFDGVAAGFTVNSATQITATAPAGSGIADVRVTTVGGQSADTAADDFTYIPAPTVTGVSPATGPQVGGTSVTITGTNLTGATTVQFGGVNAAGFTVDSATQITATAPTGTGVVGVSVTTPGGASANTPADDYTYAPVPTVTGLAPNEGPMAGGTSVTITGTGFTGASAVTFGGVNATSYVVDSATQITATAPSNAVPIVVDVRVTTPGGTSANTAADNYRYEHPCGGGGFDVDFPDVGFDPLALNGLDQTGAQDVTVPVSDLTALGLGWKVQIGTERFATAGGKQLPADAARVTNVSASALGGTCVMPSNGVSGYPLTLPLDPSKVTVFNAGAGTGLGPAALDVELELDVPASTSSGTYTSTWTVDLTAAP